MPRRPVPLLDLTGGGLVPAPTERATYENVGRLLGLRCGQPGLVCYVFGFRVRLLSTLQLGEPDERSVDRLEVGTRIAPPRFA